MFFLGVITFVKTQKQCALTKVNKTGRKEIVNS